MLNASPLGKGVRKAQIGFAVVGLTIFGVLAYKYWGKSNLWKGIIVGVGAINAYNIVKTFSKPAFQEGAMKP